MQPFEFIYYLQPLLQLLCLGHVDIAHIHLSRKDSILRLVMLTEQLALLHPIDQFDMLLGVIVLDLLILEFVKLVSNIP